MIPAAPGLEEAVAGLGQGAQSTPLARGSFLPRLEVPAHLLVQRAAPSQGTHGSGEKPEITLAPGPAEQGTGVSTFRIT